MVDVGNNRKIANMGKVAHAGIFTLLEKGASLQEVAINMKDISPPQLQYGRQKAGIQEGLNFPAAW